MLVAAPAGAGGGAWLALLAAASITAGTLLAHRLAAVDVFVLGAGQFLIGAAIIGVIAAVVDGSPLHGLTIRFVAGVLMLALPGTALPYVLWFAELRRASITAVTAWTLLVPVVGVVLAVVVSKESLTAGEATGNAIVVVAMVIVVRSGRSPCDRLRCWQQSGYTLTDPA
jgi:probable blue pigment (indigoidine) exporter